jgi:prepilin-type N-terminal cleavage/methylation domain-containing protein
MTSARRRTSFLPAVATRCGLSLIELTVVIAILAILAAMLMPRLAFIRTMSLHATSGTELQDTTNNMLTFHATQARWPHQFDSLLSANGSGGTPSGLYGSVSGTYGLDGNLTGGLLQLSTLTSQQLKSLTGLLGNPVTGGTTTMAVMDHNETITKPGNSGVFPRDMAVSGATSLQVATINPAHNVNPSDPNAASGWIISNTVFPNGNPNGDVIVALGVGPMCTAVPKTIVTPPSLYMKDATRYNRVIVLIRVSATGLQASLAGAISPDGRTLDQCLGNYRTTAER